MTVKYFASLTLVPSILTILGGIALSLNSMVNNWSMATGASSIKLFMISTCRLLIYYAFWGFIPKLTSTEPSEEDTIYGKIGKIVLRKPIFTLLATTISLGIFIFGIIGSEKSFDQLDSLPKNTESVKSFNLLRKGFSPGLLAPTNVFVQIINEYYLDPINLKM